MIPPINSAVAGASLNALGAAANIVDSDMVIGVTKKEASMGTGYEHIDLRQAVIFNSPLEFRGSRPSFNSIVLPMQGNVVARPEKVGAGANYAGLRMVYENLRSGVIFVTNQVWGRKA